MAVICLLSFLVGELPVLSNALFIVLNVSCCLFTFLAFSTCYIAHHAVNYLIGIIVHESCNEFSVFPPLEHKLTDGLIKISV